MTVVASAPGIMMDERHYPNPTEFNPENFSAENREKRSPYAFLIFGHGILNWLVDTKLRFYASSLNLGTHHIIYFTTFRPEKLHRQPPRTTQGEDRRRPRCAQLQDPGDRAHPAEAGAGSQEDER